MNIECIRQDFINKVCKYCDKHYSFSGCGKSDGTMANCATLRIWNILENKKQ